MRSAWTLLYRVPTRNRAVLGKGILLALVHAVWSNKSPCGLRKNMADEDEEEILDSWEDALDSEVPWNIFW